VRLPRRLGFGTIDRAEAAPGYGQPAEAGSCTAADPAHQLTNTPNVQLSAGLLRAGIDLVPAQIERLNLEAAGRVERSARNQRVVLVRPTARGRKLLETATRRVRSVEHAALADLSREDERTMRAWLANLAAMTMSTKKAEVKRKEKS
jgi:hypothetical protein